MNYNIYQQMNELRQNPMQFLLRSRMNIPPEYMNNPRQAVQHLMDSGQMSQDTFNRLAKMVQQMGGRL